MNPDSPISLLRDLLRGNSQALLRWILEPSLKRVLCCVAAIIIGCGLYGVALGLWRSPMMGLYVGIKLPMLIFLTLLCNGLLNGVLALLLGSGLRFKQSLLALLMSFAVLALILGGISPVAVFLASNLPSAESEFASVAHSFYLLINTALIAYTGVLANVHLYRCLTTYCPSRRVALVTLFSWLAGNGFVGAQLAWILRPFFGSPGLEVAFLREEALEGTFYGAVVRSLLRIIDQVDPVVMGSLILCTALLLLIALPLCAIIYFLKKTQKKHERKPNSQRR